MALNSSDVSAGDDILATHNNLLRQDVREANVDIATRYITIPAAAFVPQSNSSEWSKDGFQVQGGASFNSETLYAQINFPNGAIVISATAYWYRDDAAATGGCLLMRSDFQENPSGAMANCASDSTAGFHSVTDNSISSATINNVTGLYYVHITLNPNNSADDVRFQALVVEYTIVVSLP